MRKNLLCIFILFSILTHAQTTLTGIVLSDKDHKPVESASVYISGTTKGTYTDSKGYFTILDVTAPCQLVVSHLAYNVQLKSIETTVNNRLTFYLSEKATQLSGVSVKVKGKGLRNRNVKEFRDAFLGTDRWGDYANIKNDSVLVFSRQPDSISRKATTRDFEWQRKFNSIGEKSKWSKDSTWIITYSEAFLVTTKSPLLIELPFLGYDVYLDLVSFKMNSFREWTDCDYWAYYRFVPNRKATARQQEKFEKNRRDVYYNSSRHFCKALYDNKLKENGYKLALDKINDSANFFNRYNIDINTKENHLKTNEVQITGLADQKINIFYFCTYNGKPIDLTNNKYNSGSSKITWDFSDADNNSYIIFKKDTCTIRSNGTIPDNNILFGGMMATKRGGALLPYDYTPKNDD